MPHTLEGPIRKVAWVIDRLERLVDEVAALQSKLVLLIGCNQIGKTALLHALAKSKGVTPLNVGAELGCRLAGIQQSRRHLHATRILSELVDQHVADNLLLLDNIELLFDRSLKLNPLDQLKRPAHGRPVVAVWPGGLQGNSSTGRLTYAEIGHPEHQDYSLAGVVPFQI